MDDKIQLVYFGVRGRAETLRLVLHAAGQTFDDVRIDRETWAQKKPETPYGQVPYIVYKGKMYGQALAIGPFLAKKCGLYGKTDEDSLRIDEVTHLVDDFRLNIRAWRLEKDPQKQADLVARIKAEERPRYLGYFEKLLRENGDVGFFVGSSVTLADVMVYDIIDSMQTFDPDSPLSSFPLLQKLRENVGSIPSVKTYLANRPSTAY